MSTDLSKLAAEAKQDFQVWCRVTLKDKRDSLGNANEITKVLKDRVNAIYDDIINRQREISSAKENIAWHMNWIASLEKQIKDIEVASELVYPRRDNE